MKINHAYRYRMLHTCPCILTRQTMARLPANERLQRYLHLPQLVVFDLDFTLWDCDGTWCDCLSPPFKFRSGQVMEAKGRSVQLYSEVRQILDHCEQQNWKMALASRTEQPAWAGELTELLGIAHRFRYSEIYPSSKLAHFSELRKSSGFEFQQMLFFDDEIRNITKVRSLGVCCVHVPQGLSHCIFKEALQQFQSQC